MVSWQDPQALEYLHGLFRPGARPKPGLDRISELLRRLGHPERGLRTVHITGTNGKGSVAAMVAAVFRAAGYRTGRFVSPYLERFAERIVLDGEELPPGALGSLVPEVAAAIEAMAGQGWDQPTEFEAVTALACLYYQQSGAELIALEAGMGGRSDATNAIPGSLASVVSTVGLDHVERIGPTLADIAHEKSGIIRPGGVVVTGALPPEAAQVVDAQAAALGAQWLALGRDFDRHIERMDEQGARVTVLLPGETLPNLHLPLIGRHQADNLAVALMAARAAAQRGGLALDAAQIGAGIAGLSWPGRLEVLSRRPLILLDGAHNQDSIRALAAALREVFAGRRVVAVLGSLADHAQAESFASLIPLLAAAVVTTVPFAPRAMPAAAMAALLRERFPGLAAEEQPEIGRALDAGLARLRPASDDMLLVTGSFYLVGAARTYLLGDRGSMTPP